jgi:hypothetical protein
MQLSASTLLVEPHLAGGARFGAAGSTGASTGVRR